MSAAAITITKSDLHAAPIGCETLCRTCSRCVPLMWAINKWVLGWSTYMMRNELKPQPFAVVADHYTAINLLTNLPWMAALIARRLRRHWRVTVEQVNEAAIRLVVADRHNGDTFVFRVSDDSMFASRYLLHAVLHTGPDVFKMVATSFGTLVKP